MKPTRPALTSCINAQSIARLSTAAILAIAGCAGASPKREAKYATLEIEVTGQWIARYDWTHAMTAAELNALSIQELEAMVRARESEAKTDGEWAAASFLRHVLEMRRLGHKLGE